MKMYKAGNPFDCYSHPATVAPPCSTATLSQPGASPAPGGVLRGDVKLVSRKVASFPPGAAEWLPESPSVHLAGELRLSSQCIGSEVAAASTCCTRQWAQYKCHNKHPTSFPNGHYGCNAGDSVNKAHLCLCTYVHTYSADFRYSTPLKRVLHAVGPRTSASTRASTRKCVLNVWYAYIQ